jgi:hypothetical protein
MQSPAMGEVAVNFIAFDKELDACLMVLVEEAWTKPVEVHLRALQDRLYGCLDAALDGQLAAQFPDSLGKPVIIQVDCYDLDRGEIDSFISRFVEGIATVPEYSAEGSPYVSEIRFKVNHDSLAPRH